MAMWNEKKTMIWGFFILSFGLPVVVMIFATLFPFMHRNPILFGIIGCFLFVIGFIVVLKRAGKKDKYE